MSWKIFTDHKKYYKLFKILGVKKYFYVFVKIFDVYVKIFAMLCNVRGIDSD